MVPMRPSIGETNGAVAQVQRRQCKVRLRRQQRCLIFIPRRCRLVQVRLRFDALLAELGRPAVGELSLLQRRLGGCDLRLGGLHRRLVLRLLKLEQHLAGLDVAALLDRDVLDERGHPWHHLHRLDRGDPANETVIGRDVRDLDRRHRHRRWWNGGPGPVHRGVQQQQDCQDNSRAEHAVEHHLTPHAVHATSSRQVGQMRRSDPAQIVFIQS